MGLLESYLIAQAVTQGIANASPAEFLGLTGKGVGGRAYGADSGENWTIPEVIKFGSTGSAYGNYGSLQNAIKSNLRANAPMMLAQVVGIPIAFRAFSKILSKPRRQINGVMKQVGLNQFKV
jgi:hypothetical protein